MKITMNEKRLAIREVLAHADRPLTLGELSEIVGFEVKTGTTNALVGAGLIKKCGQVEKQVTRTVKVETYAWDSEAEAKLTIDENK